MKLILWAGAALLLAMVLSRCGDKKAATAPPRTAVGMGASPAADTPATAPSFGSSPVYPTPPVNPSVTLSYPQPRDPKVPVPGQLFTPTGRHDLGTSSAAPIGAEAPLSGSRGKDLPPALPQS